MCVGKNFLRLRDNIALDNLCTSSSATFFPQTEEVYGTEEGEGSCSERGGGDFCMPDVCAIITGDGEEKKCSSSADGLLARLKSWLNTRNLFYKGQMDL